MEFHSAIIRGKSIELEVDPGLADGQQVEVVILPVPRERVAGEGILRSAGALAADPEFEADMAEIQRERGLATGVSG
jgi:hypothetical protein